MSTTDWKQTGYNIDQRYQRLNNYLNQNVIPIYANLFMFPQYFLSGTFFPKTILPSGIHWLIEALPLTALNDALRKVAFEGSHLGDCWKQIGILAAWGIVIHACAIWAFRWE